MCCRERERGRKEGRKKGGGGGERTSFAARVMLRTVLLDMIPRSAGLGFIAGSEAVIADASALAVVACFICTAQDFQRRAPRQNVYAETLHLKTSEQERGIRRRHRSCRSSRERALD